MNKLLVVIITLNVLFSNLVAKELSNYYYYNTAVTARTFGLNSDRVIFTPPSSIFVLNSNTVATKLQGLGINIDNSSNYGRNIVFIKKTKLIAKLKNIIYKKYKNNLKILNIKDIYVYPIMPNSNKDFTNYKIALNYKTNQGSFRLINSKNQSIYFKYYVDATYKALIASHQIKQKQLYSSSDINVVTKKFKYLLTTPLTHSNYKSYQSNSIILKGYILSEQNSTKKADIKKGDTLKVTLNISNSLEVKADVIATEDGYIGSTIKAKSLNGKIIRVYIKDKNTFIVK